MKTLASIKGKIAIAGNLINRPAMAEQKSKF